MAAHSQRIRDSSRNSTCWNCGYAALDGCASLLIVAVGVIGLFRIAWPRHVVESWINIHVLFAVLLCGLILARYQSRIKRAPRMSATDIRELSRHFSRTVYLFLYIVIGVRQSVGILNSAWHGVAIDFNLFDDRSSSSNRIVDPGDDLQMFLASGLCALVTVRGYTVMLLRRRSSRGAAAAVQLRTGARAHQR